jgi:competence protein ComEA
VDRHYPFAFCLALFLAAGTCPSTGAATETELDRSKLDDSTLIWRAPARDAATSRATININTADAETLADVLHGVGPAKAKAIIDYRATHGPFATVSEIKRVRGIGDAVLRTNAGRMRVR